MIQPDRQPFRHAVDGYRAGGSARAVHGGLVADRSPGCGRPSPHRWPQAEAGQGGAAPLGSERLPPAERSYEQRGPAGHIPQESKRWLPKAGLGRQAAFPAASAKGPECSPLARGNRGRAPSRSTVKCLGRPRYLSKKLADENQGIQPEGFRALATTAEDRLFQHSISTRFKSCSNLARCLHDLLCMYQGVSAS